MLESKGLARGCIPNAGQILAERHDESTIATKGGPRYLPVMLQRRKDWLARSAIPDFGGPVLACCDHPTAIGTKHCRSDFVVMRQIECQRRSHRRIPELDRPTTAGEQIAVVGAKGGIVHQATMLERGENGQSRGHIPDAGSFATGGDDVAAIPAEAGPPGPILVLERRANLLAG